MASIDNLTIDPVDRSRFRVDVLASALDIVESKGPDPTISISGRPASEPDLRDGLESAYRDLARLASHPRRAGRPGRPRERRTPVDAAMTETTATTCPSCAAPVGAGERVLRGLRCRAVAQRGDRRDAGDRPGATADPTRDRARDRRAARDGRHRHRPDPRSALPRVRRGDRRGRLLHAVRRQGPQPARPLHRAAGELGGRRRATAGCATPATRTPWPWTRGPSPAATPSWWSATGSRTRSTPTSPAWRPRGRLVTSSPTRPRAGSGPRAPGSRPPAKALEAAADAANDAVVANTVAGPGKPGRRAPSSPGWSTPPSSSSAGSATAVPTGSPTTGEPQLLTVDDSFAAEQIAQGVARAEAETGAAGPRDHPVARVGLPRPRAAHGLPGPRRARLGAGLLGRPVELLLRARRPDRRWCRSSSPTPPDPLPLAEALVDWANVQGGVDNITVALARIDPPTQEGNPDGHVHS